MSTLGFARPQSLPEALALHTQAPRPGEDASDGRLWLAGGQSLLAAMKLGMLSPSLLIDLQDLPELRDIGVEHATSGELHSGHLKATALNVGAMATHASVAASALVQQAWPGLATLAGGIADAQVRQMGTLGGSLAHNDPAACWPAGVLAAGATLVTNQREISADHYFQGLYHTALAPGELIVRVRFPRLEGLHYLKFEQPASRFALVGVAVARSGKGAPVRVAVTGLGLGVVRWPEAERALGERFELAALQEALAKGAANALQALSDLHASADYRRHLAGVLALRCVAALGGGPLPTPAPLARHVPASTVPANASGTASPPDAAAGPPTGHTPLDGFGDVQHLPAAAPQVWHTLLDPAQLQGCIPGCQALVQTRSDAYEATVKVGLGPLSVRFKSEVLLRDLQAPHSLTLVFQGDAGALGRGQGTARVRLEPAGANQTRLLWQVQVQLSGRLAQFGNRLVEATARQLSAEFFARVGTALHAQTGRPPQPAPTRPWWRRLLDLFFPSPGK